MKKLTVWLGTVVLIMLMAGCSRSKPNPVSEESPMVKPAPPLELIPAKPAEKTQDKTTEGKPTDPYQLMHFTARFKSYKALDKVPALYLTEQYNIKQWKLRKLPAPVEGSHWTYFGGAYVEITDSEGVIGRIYSGDNIYR